MIKFYIMFQIDERTITEYRGEFDADKERESIARDELFEPTNFEIFCRKANEVIYSERFKNAQMIALSYGRLKL